MPNPAKKPSAKKSSPKSKPARAKTKLAQPAVAPSDAGKKAEAASKQSRVIAMLQSSAGTTIAAMMQATGWQQHSVRGFLAGVVRKKLKLNLESKKVDGNRVYHIEGEAPPPNAKVSRPDGYAARESRSGTAGSEDARCRDRTPARSRRRRASCALARRVPAATAPLPAPTSTIPYAGLPAS